MDDLVLLMRQVHFTANVTQPQVLTTFPTPIDPNQLCGRSTKDNSLVTNTRFYVAGVSVGATGSLGLFGKKSTDYLYTCVFSYTYINHLFTTSHSPHRPHYPIYFDFEPSLKICFILISKYVPRNST